MGQIQWGTEEAKEELGDLAQNTELVFLDLDERQQNSRVFNYSLTIATDSALSFVHLGPREKTTTLAESVKTFRRAYERRRKVSELLCVPDHIYQGDGEKILPAFSKQELVGSDGKYLSPQQELILVRDILSIAQIMGPEKILRLGRIPSHADYHSALTYLANEEQEQLEDLSRGAREA